jgi:glycosyltransferase involved in cell wall biosynthesis
VFSSSRCSAQWCEQYYGLDSEAVPVIHTGVDCRTFRPGHEPKEECPTIIFVGKIERNKGVELLVEAACRVAPRIPHLRLRLLGRGNAELAEQLRLRANDAGYPALLDLAGFVSHGRLPQHLSRAHIFAAPSEYEGGPGFVYLEAMACGLPVIACSGSGAAEVVMSGQNGLLVPPRDVDALVQALLRLLQDRGLREQMGQQAREYVLREADREKCLRRLESFYASVLSGVSVQEVVN